MIVHENSSYHDMLFPSMSNHLCYGVGSSDDCLSMLQMGVPADREQYIHRLGRTGRKGKEGKGILLLAPWEEFFLSTLRDLPVVKASLPSVDPDAKKTVGFFHDLNTSFHFYIWKLWKHAYVLVSLTNTGC